MRRAGGLPRPWALSSGEIVYTSCATESNNMAVFGSQRRRREHGGLITVKTEHASVIEVYHYMEQLGYPVTYLDVDFHRRGTAGCAGGGAQVQYVPDIDHARQQ